MAPAPCRTTARLGMRAYTKQTKCARETTLGASSSASRVEDPEREAHRAAWRKRKNLKRKQARRHYAAELAKPPLQALSKQMFVVVTGCAPEQYDLYAAQFIEAAKKVHRRWEFPHEPKF